ncbi:MAG: hypothetical protein GY808_10990, partial [Gammaproteobacteria bacterium]|nr:hypothetical protein [Gammaproteobacteria bacterium]
MFMDVYNGIDAQGVTGYQPGYKLDYPFSKGNCANCHAPIAAVNNTIGVDLNKLEGVQKTGISCDFCHKVKDIHLKENTNINTGVMMMELLRPAEDEHLAFGPYDDSVENYTYSPIISKSEFCAPCHQGSFWGVPIYESYSEWLDSPYPKRDIHCQDCHMASNNIRNKITRSDDKILRDPATVHSH